jgi:4-hydroxy-tetrahydrodipicolinate reductase
MKIALWGYGKMGKAIEEAGLERGYQFPIKAGRKDDLKGFDYSGISAIIEFTAPESAVDNINTAIELGVPIVVGTTGWNKELVNVTVNVKENKAKLLHASNFSIGVNLFFKLNEDLAKLMDAYPEYKVALEEIHHTQKLDAPSGTAITLADGVLANNTKFDSWELSEDKEIEDKLPIVALREPNVPGTHSLEYKSEIDSIKIKHTAFNRKGFATGSLVAAKWLSEQSSGVYTMRNVLNID